LENLSAFVQKMAALTQSEAALTITRKAGDFEVVPGLKADRIVIRLSGGGEGLKILSDMLFGGQDGLTLLVAQHKGIALAGLGTQDRAAAHIRQLEKNLTAGKGSITGAEAYKKIAPELDKGLVSYTSEDTVQRLRWTVAMYEKMGMPEKILAVFRQMIPEKGSAITTGFMTAQKGNLEFKITVPVNLIGSYGRMMGGMAGTFMMGRGE
jgi:hypothetical protein